VCVAVCVRACMRACVRVGLYTQTRRHEVHELKFVTSVTDRRTRNKQEGYHNIISRFVNKVNHANMRHNCKCCLIY